MCSKTLEKLIKNRYLRFGAMIFLAGFLLGYTLRLFDFITAPVFSRIGVLYPIHNEARFHAYTEMKAYGVKTSIFGDEMLEKKVDALYVMRNNVVSSFLLITTGVVFAIPGIFMTFLVGVSVGASFPEVVEFLPAELALKTVGLAALYIAAILIAASIGLEIGAMMLNTVRQKKIKLKRDLYDRFVMLLALILINIILQYVLLVMG